MLRPTVLEVNLAAIQHNVRQHQAIVPHGAAIMAVVKADGYGHGAVEVLKAAISEGIQWAGVALMEEAIALRDEGIKLPILLLGGWHLNAIPLFFQYNVTPSLYSLAHAKALNEYANKNGTPIKVHLKLETGMGRLGFNEQQLSRWLQSKADFPYLQLAGIYTHLSSADEEDQDFSLGQLTRFFDLLQQYVPEHALLWIHVCNSAGISLLSVPRGNLFRLGISLYGMPPSETFNNKVDLQEAITWKSSVVQLQWYPAGSPISYGKTYYTEQKTLIATVCVGYADGYSRQLSNRGSVLVHGQRAPVIGKVCMDMIMVDVTHIKDIALWDEVVLIGRQQNETISATEIANLINTINYEVVCQISKRVPRVYINPA